MSKNVIRKTWTRLLTLMALVGVLSGCIEDDASGVYSYQESAVTWIDTNCFDSEWSEGYGRVLTPSAEILLQPDIQESMKA